MNNLGIYHQISHALFKFNSKNPDPPTNSIDAPMEEEALGMANSCLEQMLFPARDGTIAHRDEYPSLGGCHAIEYQLRWEIDLSQLFSVRS